MNAQEIGAWLLGCGILLVTGLAAWLCVTNGVFARWTGIFKWTPVIASFVTAWRAGEHKVLLGSSLCIPATLFVVAMNAIHVGLGKPSDFRGPKGVKILFFMNLAWTLLCCSAGAALAWFLTRKRGA